MPKIEEPLKTKRFSGLFRFIEKTAQSEINRATLKRKRQIPEEICLKSLN
ncbi:hypothetical protein [Treponema bryantii]|nr:hypothetical protein [Treponema bryantii]